MMAAAGTAPWDRYRPRVTMDGVITTAKPRRAKSSRTASAFGWILAYFHIPQLVVNAVAGWGGSVTTVGIITAVAFLFIGCFIDAIPAIIIVGTILAPLAGG